MFSFSIRANTLVVVSAVAAAFSLFGCSSATGPGTFGADGGGAGEDSGGGGGDGGGGGGDGGGGSTFTCCINKAFYDCGNKAALDKCAGFDMGSCLAMCAPGDFMCIERCDEQLRTSTPDPSSCTRVASRDGDCNTGGVCVAGSSCTYNSDCGSDKHCTSGRCYADKPGCPCTYNSECGSTGHCTSGKCYSDTVGSPCTYNSECGSDAHCTSGKCWKDESGSPCTYNSECGAGSCVSGRCT